MGDEHPVRECAQSAQLRSLIALLQDDDVDAAVGAGLMDYAPCCTQCAAFDAPVREAQSRLRTAWAARDRYRARALRLQRRAGERDARRRPNIATATRPALPAAAAEILARAKAKAAAKGGHDPA